MSFFNTCLFWLNSNTTNVKVKLSKVSVGSPFGKNIQIQPMLRLNPKPDNPVMVRQMNSNTTNVKVKPTYLKALCQYYTLKSLILQVFSLFLPGGNLLLLVADTICDNSFIYKGFLSFDKISAW